MRTDSLAQVLDEIRQCQRCVEHLPCGPRPVVQAGQSSRLCIIGQAPGRKVHETGIPWDDASGRRLREWLGLSCETFYDPDKIAIIPMGFCYPGKAASGDNPPRPECAPLWHDRLKEQLPDIRLTLLIGQYAQAYYLKASRKATLGETVRAWQDYLPLGCLPLPHPSPRNQLWIHRNPWFESDVIPQIQGIIRPIVL